MVPQSVRGIKKIEFSLSKEEKKALQEGNSRGTAAFGGNKTGGFSNMTIPEENSPMATSKSGSSS